MSAVREVLGRLDAGYARKAMRTLVEMSPHKVAGTAAEHEAAEWLKSEMQRLGLKDVRMEPYTVSVADVSAGGAVEVAAPERLTIQGVPMPHSWPTPPGGVEGELVYVGGGTPEEIQGDVRGKIVVFRRRWPDTGAEGAFRSVVVAELWSRGAVGLICYEDLGPSDSIRLQELMLNGSGIRIPVLSIASRDAHRLISLIESAHSVRARLVSRVEEPHDGVSYNVVGAIPGSRRPDEYVILASHYDTWFYGAADTLSGVGAILGIAKAIIEAGFRPERTILFVAHGAEEQGLPTWTDWLIGSYSLIHLAHADWVGKVVAELNIDVVFHHPDYATVEMTPELLQPIQRAAQEAGISGGNFMAASSPASFLTFVDSGSYVTAGVPSADITFSTPEYWEFYHTAYDSVAMVTEASLAWTMKLWAAAAARLATDAAIPLSAATALQAVSGALAADARHLASAGLQTTQVREALDAINQAMGPAVLLETLAASATDLAAVDKSNLALLRVLADVNSKMRIVGGPNLSYLYYLPDPYVHDAGHIAAGIRALRAGDTARALEELDQVYAIVNAGRMSPEAHETYMRQALGNSGAWAKNVQKLIDVYPQWSELRAASAGRSAAKGDALASGLDSCLEATLEEANRALAAVAAVAGECRKLLLKTISELEPLVARPGQSNPDLFGRRD